MRKNNVSLDNFLSDTSTARPLHLDWRKKHQHSFSGSDFGICVAQNQKRFEDQGLIIEVK